MFNGLKDAIKNLGWMNRNGVIFHDPGQDRMIFEVYAWVAVDPKTNLESLCAIMTKDGPPFQAVSSSLETIMMMKDYFTSFAKASGKKLKLVKFRDCEVLETV